MQAYLFVHFREMSTPEGEQVYFSVSRDGFHWEKINDGRPILWSYLGEKGVRDCTIIRCAADGKYRILATDLSLAYRYRVTRFHDWHGISHSGSKCLSMWESEDLVNWSEQRLLPIGTEEFGCLWAPDIIYDRKNADYVIHWSSTHRDEAYMGIYCCRTKDFKTFTQPKLLYRKEDAGIIDSAIYEEDGFYYLFVKCDHNPETILLLRSKQVDGGYERVDAFDESMKAIEEGLYEGPTATRLADGRWCLFLDYYGVPGTGQGYVPFLADTLASGDFHRADRAFSFPYGFKHGTVLPICLEEYERIKNQDWSDKGWQ
jgi:hypothetical protein